MAVPVGPIIAGLMKLKTSGRARWILAVLLALISKMKSPSIRVLMISIVPKVTEASFAQMTVGDRKAVIQMLASLVEKFGVTNGLDKTHGEENFKRKLQELGLLEEVRSRPKQTRGNRTLINVKGKPLSETIIEERR